MEYSEIKHNQQLIKKHRVAYSIGLHTDTPNKYNIASENWKAFNLGRVARVTQRRAK